MSLAILRGFFRAVRGQPQDEIIFEFLEAIVGAFDEVNGGSVLIANRERKVLVLYNEGDRLFMRRTLDPNRKASWPPEMSIFGSVAGKCFRTRSTVHYEKGEASDDDYFGQSPIENMVCVPIMVGGDIPFGVVCLHNDIPGKVISPELTQVFEDYVAILGVALHSPLPELKIDHNIFIVHGRDMGPARELEKLIRDLGGEPKLLVDQDKNAELILVALETLIDSCKAGFVLLTPDDLGRYKNDAELLPRARESVIFEAGLLIARYRASGRVCLLLQEPTVPPVDLAGVTYERFRAISDLHGSVETKLRKWGVPARAK